MKSTGLKVRPDKSYWPILCGLLLICLLMVAKPITASDKPIDINADTHFAPHFEELSLKQTAMATWFFYDVYQAALYSDAPTPEALLTGHYAIHLELLYLRPLNREDVIAAAEKILKRQLAPKTLALYQALINDLHSHYRNIDKGDRYSITYRVGEPLQLCYNRYVCHQFGNTAFARIYLNIWLGQQPISDDLREALLSWQHNS